MKSGLQKDTKRGNPDTKREKIKMPSATLYNLEGGINRHIDYVIAVAECGSISRASEILHISQPSLSRYLSNLEQELGFSLFVRTFNGIALTEAGRIYVEYAKEIKLLWSTMKFKIREQKRSEKIRIGMTLNATSFSVFDVIENVKKRYANSSIEFFNVMSKDIESALSEGQFDFAIGPDLMLPSRFSYDCIYTDPYILVVPDHYDLQDKIEYRDNMNFPFIDIRKIPEVDYILQDQNTSVRKGIDAICGNLNFELKPKMIVTNSMLAMQAAENRMGCCITVLGHLAYLNHVDHLRFYQISEEIFASAGIIYLRDRNFSKEERYCISCIKKGLILGEKKILERIREAEKSPD